MRNRRMSAAVAAAMALTLGLNVDTLADPPLAPKQTKSNPDARPVWQCTLLPESRLVDDCYCGRPTITVPMKGTFQLQWLSEDPLFARYAVTNISFVARVPGGTTYAVTGQGLYAVGGEVGRLQSLSLELWIDNGVTNRFCSFTNDTPFLERLWPMLKIHLDETNQAPMQFYRLDLAAAPLREIWFSTTAGFNPGGWHSPTNDISPGDLLSSAGRVVKHNRELIQNLGLMPGFTDLGFDAVDLLPGGEIAFSIPQDIFSERLGALHSGDVLSDRGRVVTNYADLIGAFGPEPPPVDEGLDALQFMPNGEIYFSVTNDFFSETLGRMIRKGDLLSSRGVIVKANEELMACFLPAFPKQDYGLDAVHVWPSGEVWFSVETGFYGQHFDSYGPGDLLSDQGYVVYTSQQLLSAFQPLETLADFGLDALFIVSDADLPATTNQTASATLRLHISANSLSFDWTSSGRAFQIERAVSLIGPWLPLSPVLTEGPVVDDGALANASQTFYRLRQW
jgi:hypothetical protein